MSNPQDRVLDLLYGRWRTQTLYAGVKLGVFDVVGAQPRPAAEMARELGLDGALLYRLLRALGALGLLDERPGQAFSITAVGAFLQKEHPQSLRDVVLLREGPEHTAAWKHLTAIVRDGKQNGFVREFGRMAFEYAAQEQAYAAAFDAGMSSHSRLQPPQTARGRADVGAGGAARLRFFGDHAGVRCGKRAGASATWPAPSWNEPALSRTSRRCRRSGLSSAIAAAMWQAICLPMCLQPRRTS